MTTATGKLDVQDDYRAYVRRSIEAISNVLCAVADGDYQQFASSERDDEFGDLAMMVNIVVNAVRRAVEAQRSAAQAAGDEATQKESALAELRDKIDVIERQRQAIDELSTPVLQIWEGVLCLPVIGVVDSRRAQEIMERLLTEVCTRQARFVIVDITGVEVVDTKTADHFVKIATAAQLLGARAILTGLRPAVAQTLVDIGVDLGTVKTMRNLQQALKECLRQMEPAAERART